MMNLNSDSVGSAERVVNVLIQIIRGTTVQFIYCTGGLCTLLHWPPPWLKPVHKQSRQVKYRYHTLLLFSPNLSPSEASPRLSSSPDNILVTPELTWCALKNPADILPQYLSSSPTKRCCQGSFFFSI